MDNCVIEKEKPCIFFLQTGTVIEMNNLLFIKQRPVKILLSVTMSVAHRALS